MQAAQGYQDLVHATRAQLEANGQLDKWRQQQQQQHEQAAQTAGSRIARIEICDRCQGHRIEKVVYQGHMVLERTCSQCNGEGVITKPESLMATTGAPAAARRQTQSRATTSTQVPSVQSA